VAPTPRDSPGADTEQLSRLAGFVRSVVAPTTALTALLFYFGWAHAFWFLDHFGVRSTVLGLTTRDYVMRSVDGLFVPVTVLALAVLVVVWGRRLVPGLTRTTSAVLDRPAVHCSVVAAGAVAVLVGLSALVVPTPLTRVLAVAPLSLVGGILVLTWVLHRRDDSRPHLPARPADRSDDDQRDAGPADHRDGDGDDRRDVRADDRVAGPTPARRTGRSGAEWAAAAALVFVGLFWFATDYAASVGGTRARQLVAELEDEPGVVVHSQTRLALTGSGVTELACGPGSAHAYRYDGLRLVLYSADQFVLVPVGWTRADGAAVLLPRSETTLLEFTPRTSTAEPVTRC
jgi:hypothetical protein